MGTLLLRRAGVAHCIVILAILSATAACAPGSPARTEPSPAVSFSELAILPALEFANAPQVILAAARDFRQICLEMEVDRVLGRMDARTGVWLEFAVVYDGAFYVLPALGYHTPYDRYDAETLHVPDSKTYYELQRRDIPSHRYRFYFVD